MAGAHETDRERATPSHRVVLHLVFWLALLILLKLLLVGRVQQERRWEALVSERLSLISHEWQDTTSLWRRVEGFRRDGQWSENGVGIKLKPTELEESRDWYPLRCRVFVADKLSGQLRLYVWLDEARVAQVVGLFPDERGRLWGKISNYDDLVAIWDTDGRPYAATRSPTWLRLSVCNAPAWLVAIDSTARYAWLAWIPFAVLAFAGCRPRHSVDVVLAATLAAFVSAALDVWLCGQPVVAAHLTPLYLGFPLSAFLLVWTRSCQAGIELAVEPVIATPLPQIAGDRPDWTTIADDVHCPLCGYNLRGLERPLCPECGLQFRWVEVFEAARARHPYLYEHQPWWSVRAMLKTLCSGLNPGRFWPQLSPVHRVAQGRLLLYFLLCQMLIASPMLAGAILNGLLPSSGAWPMLPESWQRSDSVPLHIAMSVLCADVGDATLYWWIAFAAWPLITLSVLMVCQTTFRRVGVKLRHVVRAVVYAGDITALAAVSMVGACLAAFVVRDSGGHAAYAFALINLTVYPLLLLRLATACRCYLRIRHAWATAIATQVVFLLTVAILRVVTW